MGSAAASQFAVARLGPGGTIGRHPAATTQMLVVLQGEALVSGSDDDTLLVGPGRAVVWDDGEQHETRTALGLLALIIEGDLTL